jgi:hypothetical protein
MRCGRLEARWRGAAWCVALIVVCVLVALVWRDRRPVAETPGSPITPSIRAAPIRPSALVPPSAAPKPVAAAASSAAVMRNRSLMCGQPDEAGSPITGSQINAQLEAGAKTGLRRVIPSLQRSNDPIDRMMGALLAEQVPELAPGSPSAEDAMTVFVQQGRDAANGRVLAVAAMHCHRSSAPPAPGSPCALIDLSSWAEKDAGNAAPWLMLARRAHAGGDEAAFDDAMRHAATAQRFDYGSLELLRLLDHVAVRRLPPSIRVPTMMALAGLWVSWPTPGHAAVSAWCAQGLEDPNRIAACSDLAYLLVHRSSSMLDVALGLRIAPASGWTVEEVAKEQARREAFEAALNRAKPRSKPLSCEWMREFANWSREVSRGGELAMARRLVVARPLN